MKFLKSKDKKWMDKKGYSKKIFFDGKDLNSPGTRLQKVKIKLKEKAKAHHHKKQTEIFYFLTDNGYWIINEKKFSFNVGDALVIEPLDEHTVVNDSKEDYVYLSFKFGYEEDDLYWS